MTTVPHLRTLAELERVKEVLESSELADCLEIAVVDTQLIVSTPERNIEITVDEWIINQSIKVATTNTNDQKIFIMWSLTNSCRFTLEQLSIGQGYRTHVS